jgi:hypothetical protein
MAAERRVPKAVRYQRKRIFPTDVLSSLIKSGVFVTGAAQIRLFPVNFHSTAINGITFPNFTPNFALGADIFLNTDLDPSSFQLSDVAETVLEELGHAYNYASGLGGSSIVYDNPLFTGTYPDPANGIPVSAGQYNFLTIMRNCDK